jgi:protein-tyrosine phosphatase
MHIRLNWIAEVPVRLAITRRPRGGDWLEVDAAALRQTGVDTLASLLTDDEMSEFALHSEHAVCACGGIDFRRYPVPDRGVPPDPVSWLQFVKELASEAEAGRTVAIHCRMGIGRSALLAASILVQIGMEATDALERIAQARGCPVPDTAEQRQWLCGLGGADRKAKQ